MSLGEYTEVGAIINDFASNDANVKVGTSIDPNLEGQLNVVVVATGLNNHPEKSATIVDVPVIMPVPRQEEPEMVVPQLSETDEDYYDIPPHLRKNRSHRARSQAEGSTARAVQPEQKSELVNISTFLRRQAD